MSKDAINIYQRFLDEMSDAILVRDADTFVRRIFLPHVLQTDDQLIEFNDSETAHKQFLGFANALASLGIDAYVRIATSAEFRGRTKILGEHESYMMSAGKLVVPKFSNKMQIEFRDDLWGLTTTRHFAKYLSWPDLLPRSND